ncbi:MAG: hypothetical protein EON58_06850 [Alphaproteobacteria bacterium]|nr:MAG: hypothetical protein EON58_06850 [Alphaproteobacteria bacterium]
MSAYPLSEFHEAIRTMLGDEGDSAGGYDYVEDQLNGALRTIVRMGFLPCLRLSGGSNPITLTTAPANPDTWAYLAAKAAWVLAGGGVDHSIRTRAMSFTPSSGSRRDAVEFLASLLSDIDARGNVCGTADDTGHKGLFACQGDLMTYIAFPCPPFPVSGPPSCCP